MNRLLVIIALLALAGGCAELPRDPEGTLDRIMRDRTFRVGIVASGSVSPGVHQGRALIERVAAAAGARPMLEAGAAEPLLMRLEQGELDLVIGEFHSKSPWMTHVHLLPPLASSRAGEEETMVAAATRNGENRWIRLVDRESRALAPPQ